MRETGRGHSEQLLGQPLGRLVGVFGEDDLIEVLGCRANRLHDGRMPVAMRDHPPGRDGIEDPPPVRGVDIGALRAHGLRKARAQRVLGKGMPDDRATLVGQFKLRDESPCEAGPEKDSRSNACANAAVSADGVSGSSCGKRPSTVIFPSDPMLRSFSGCASPTNATPTNGIARRRSASIDKRV